MLGVVAACRAPQAALAFCAEVETGQPQQPSSRSRVARILADAWRQAFRRGGRSTVGAIAIALAGSVVAFVLLHQFNAGGLVVQVTVAMIVLFALFVVALVGIAARIEREREQARRDHLVLQCRIGVALIIGEVVRDLDLELARPDALIDEGRLRYYADRALSAVRSDRLANVERTRELDVFFEPSPDHPHERFQQLREMLRDNLLQGAYLRG